MRRTRQAEPHEAAHLAAAVGGQAPARRARQRRGEQAQRADQGRAHGGADRRWGRRAERGGECEVGGEHREVSSTQIVTGVQSRRAKLRAKGPVSPGAQAEALSRAGKDRFRGQRHGTRYARGNAYASGIRWALAWRDRAAGLWRVLVARRRRRRGHGRDDRRGEQYGRARRRPDQHARGSARGRPAAVPRRGMAMVGAFCIDRWEDVRRRARRPGQRAPALALRRRRRAHGAREDRPDVVPQGYISQVQATQACNSAGKRLCSADEFHLACEGPNRRQLVPLRRRDAHPRLLQRGQGQHGARLLRQQRRSGRTPTSTTRG